MQDSAALPFGLFGEAPRRLVDYPSDAVQCSPLIPGAADLAAMSPASLSGMVMLAPPRTLERRHDTAATLRALAPEASFVVLAPKDMGGARIGRELERFGCSFTENAKAHFRICRAVRPEAIDEALLQEALDAGAPRRLDGLGLWSQPGIFSWDRVDPGTALLIDALPQFAGRGADFGCGIGLLAHAILATSAVTRLDLVDIDRRAVEAARRNVDDSRVGFHWTDVAKGTGLQDLDFAVMNPPFHEAGHERKGLGQAFVRQAASALRRGGQLWLVANRHLPYEAVLVPLFRSVTPRTDAQGFKVIEAIK